MSGVREIKFTIDKKTGDMKTETIGFKGSTCEEVLDEFSKDMGAKVVDRKNKPERFQPLSDAEAAKERQKLTKK